jgi:hypothetical protein
MTSRTLCEASILIDNKAAIKRPKHVLMLRGSWPAYLEKLRKTSVTKTVRFDQTWMFGVASQPDSATGTFGSGAPL